MFFLQQSVSCSHLTGPCLYLASCRSHCSARLAVGYKCLPCEMLNLKASRMSMTFPPVPDTRLLIVGLPFLFLPSAFSEQNTVHSEWHKPYEKNFQNPRDKIHIGILAIGTTTLKDARRKSSTTATLETTFTIDFQKRKEVSRNRVDIQRDQHPAQEGTTSPERRCCIRASTRSARHVVDARGLRLANPTIHL